MNQEILTPMIAMMLLTFAVWLYMFWLRISSMQSMKINAEKLKHRKGKEILGDDINAPSENLQNLFELPVLFYAVCITLFVTQKVDPLYLNLAYAFVVFRVFHSLIHCSYNQVMHRFGVYMLSSVALFTMIIRLSIDLLS